MNTTPASGALVDRTLANLRNAWREVTDSARVALTGVVRPDLPPEDSDRIERQIAACLEGRGGLFVAPLTQVQPTQLLPGFRPLRSQLQDLEQSGFGLFVKTLLGVEQGEGVEARCIVWMVGSCSLQQLDSLGVAPLVGADDA